MTDETRLPTPEPGKSAAAGKDDALDSWFRPGAKGEPAEAAAAETEEAGETRASGESVDAADAQEQVQEQEQEQSDRHERSDPHERGDEDESQRASDEDGAREAEQSAAEADEGGHAEQRTEETGEAGQAERSATEADEDGHAEQQGREEPAAAPIDSTQVMPVIPATSPAPNKGGESPDKQLTQVVPAAALHSGGSGGAAPAWAPGSDMAVRPATTAPETGQDGDGSSWRPEPGPQTGPQSARPQYRGAQGARTGAGRSQSFEPAKAYQEQAQPQTRPFQTQAPGGNASILPVRTYDDDDFDRYSFGGERRPHSALRRALMTTAGVAVLVLAVVAALAFSGKIKVLGIGASPVPTVGFSPSGSDAGSYATQTGTAFLTDWQNGNLKAAANITDDPSAALAQLTAYKKDLKLSGLTLMPGSASAKGWMTFSVTAQVGMPSSAWSYSSGLAVYSADVNGYTRWFVKWQPSVLFTSLKPGQKLALGIIPPTANKVVDRTGAEITGANAPSLNGIVSALKKSAPVTDGTPGQVVQIQNADGSVAAKVDKVSDPVSTSAVKTTIDLKLQAAAQSAVNQAPNSSMVVIQPSTGNILAVANNPPGGLDIAMVGHYAPGSTFKTITTALVLNKGVISSLNQTWDCPATLNADGITLHNSEQEAGVGKSFLWDFAQSCNNAFSRFEGKVSRSDLAATAHDYFGFNQKWDVGLGQPTTYGNVPDTSGNSLAEELVGQDQITASPLTMASVAATIANGSFKQPILVPGTQQITVTPLSASVDRNLKTLMHEVVVSGTLAGVLPVQGVYAKTGTAEVQGKKPNSWTIAFKGDTAVAALAVNGGFGASTAGPEVKTLLGAVK